MTTSAETEHDDAWEPAPAGDGAFGWKRSADRPRHTGVGTRPASGRGTTSGGGTPAPRRRNGTLARQRTGTPAEHPPGTPDDRNAVVAADRNAGTPGERDDRSGVAGPVTHEFVVPGPVDVERSGDERSGAALAGRAAEAALSSVGNLRFVNQPIGSLKDLLRDARHCHFNLSHHDAGRALHLAFFILVTVLFLIPIWPLLWVFVLRLHRAVTAWSLALICAPFLNSLADGLVWDGFDMTTWSPTTWQLVCGGLLVFLLTALGIYLRNAPRR